MESQTGVGVVFILKRPARRDRRIEYECHQNLRPSSRAESSSFNVILPPGQSAAMAVGAVADTPICREGKIVIVLLSAVTLTVDHRVINGREAGQFLARLKETMEKL